MKYIYSFLLITNISFATVIKKKDISPLIIDLVLTNAYPNGLGTYRLVTPNSIEMSFSCANNQAYDYNKRPFLEYRNYYNVAIGRFYFSENSICLDLKDFIEKLHYEINDTNPFHFVLNTQTKLIEEISYPTIDAYKLEGDESFIYNIKKFELYEEALY